MSNLQILGSHYVPVNVHWVYSGEQDRMALSLEEVQ